MSGRDWEFIAGMSVGALNASVLVQFPVLWFDFSAIRNLLEVGRQAGQAEPKPAA